MVLVSKHTKALTVRAKTIKLINKQVKTCMMPNPQAKKEKTGKLDFIKIKKLRCIKGHNHVSKNNLQSVENVCKSCT